MGISKNRGTPKSSILIGFSIINHPFGGKNTTIFGNTHIHIPTILHCVEPEKLLLCLCRCCFSTSRGHYEVPSFGEGGCISIIDITHLTQMTLVLLEKGLVLEAWPSKIDVIWVLGIYTRSFSTYIYWGGSIIHGRDVPQISWTIPMNFWKAKHLRFVM